MNNLIAENYGINSYYFSKIEPMIVRFDERRENRDRIFNQY